MRIFSYLFLSCVCGIVFGLLIANSIPDNVFAVENKSTWKEYNMNVRGPDEILIDIVGKKQGTSTSREKSDIIVTKLDGVTNTQAFDNPDNPNKISGTLESVRLNISFYLQWIVYLALSGAVLLIVYNGLRLVVSPVSAEEASAIKSRMIYIALGIVLVTGFYFVLKIFLAIYSQIFVF